MRNDRMKNVENNFCRSNDSRTFDTLTTVGLCTSIFHSQDTPRRVDALKFLGTDSDKPSAPSEVSCVMSSSKKMYDPHLDAPDIQYNTTKYHLLRKFDFKRGKLYWRNTCALFHFEKTGYNG